MTITPRFEITQTETEVHVIVSVPTTRITNLEVLLEDSILHFYASPYLLKLDFAPNELSPETQGIVSAQYNPSEQTVRIPLVKATPNVDWPNLDLTARLLQPKEIPSQWLHSVETTSGTNETPENAPAIPPQGYGFGQLFQNIFTDYCRAGLAQEMLQLPEPETSTPEERREQRQQAEQAFDADRYVQDLYIAEDYLYPLVMEFQPFWKTTLAQQMDQLQLEDKPAFTSDEKLLLSTIPYPLIPKSLFPSKTENSIHPLWYGLLDLLVAFVYDHLTTLGDPSVESAWTITILSSSLSWLDPPTSLSEAVVTSTRRMLLYPYWRNWEFAMYVWKTTLDLLDIHKITQALLRIRTILEKSESYYVGNKLFVDPYLYWIQQLDRVPSDLIQSLRQEVGNVDKSMIQLPLVETEQLLLASNEEAADDEDDSSEDDDSEDDSSEDDDSEDDSSDDDDSSDESSDSEEIDNQPENNTLLDGQVGHGTSILQIVDPTEVTENTTQQPKKGALIQEL